MESEAGPQLLNNCGSYLKPVSVTFDGGGVGVGVGGRSVGTTMGVERRVAAVVAAAVAVASGEGVGGKTRVETLATCTGVGRFAGCGATTSRTCPQNSSTRTCTRESVS